VGNTPIQSKHLLNLHLNYEENMSRSAIRLHDDVTTAISQLKLKLNLLCSDLAGGDLGHTKEIIAINQDLDQILNRSRGITEDMRPPVLDDLGLGDALQWQARAYSEESEINVYMEHNFKGNDLPEPLKTGIFRLFQDLLKNLSHVNEATSVKLAFDKKESSLIIHYQDNGIGLSLALAEGHDVKEMILIQARVLGLEGELSFGTPSQEGNDFRIILPLKARTIHKEGKL
jgi:signal transduction histidine kinase